MPAVTKGWRTVTLRVDWGSPAPTVPRRSPQGDDGGSQGAPGRGGPRSPTHALCRVPHPSPRPSVSLVLVKRVT